VTGNLADAVRHDLHELVRDLAQYVGTVGGGTLAHNQEVVADYLIALMGAQNGDTVTDRLLTGARAYAVNRKGENR
jgi:hypothetical protein